MVDKGQVFMEQFQLINGRKNVGNRIEKSKIKQKNIKD